MTTRVDIVERALGAFLQEQQASSSSSLLDEIVLNYVAGIADDISLLDADATEEDDSFDVDEFVEMMDAYLPGFAQIPGEKVKDWMFRLAGSLRESHEDDKLAKMAEHSESCSVRKTDSSPVSSLPEQARSIPLDSPSPTVPPRERGDQEDKAVSLLLEMFPASCQVEVQHCLGVAGGNVDEAAELVLCRQLSGENITNPLHTQPPRKTAGAGDKDIKQKIVNQYMFSYVDSAATGGGSRNDPNKMTLSIAEKKEPKKLVRYLDSKVVNTKGQRFTEVKKPETEEMKKTYINLKPARQYRFH